MENHNTRLGNFALNLSSSWLKFLLSTVAGFILTPFILKGVGHDAYGVFKTLLEIIAYFLLLEYGLHGSLLAVFNKVVHAEDRNQVFQTFYLGLRSFVKIMVVCITVGLLFAPLLPKLIKIEHMPERSLYLSYCILLLGFLALPFQTFKTYIESSQKIYQIHSALTLQLLINNILIILSLYLKLGVPGLCASLIISNVFFNFVLFKFSKVELSKIKEAANEANKNESLKKWINKMRKATFFNDVSGRVFLFSDNIIIGFLLGAKFVTPFFITQRLPQLVQSQLQSVSSAGWAGFGEIYHKKGTEALNQTLIELTKWVSVLAIAALIPIASYNEFFVNLWTGPTTFGGKWITYIACGNAFFMAYLSLWSWCFTLSSKIDLLVPYNIFHAIINLTLNIVFTLKFGLIGPIAATLICYVFISTVWLSYLLKKEFHINIFRIHLNWILPLLLGFASFYLWKSVRGPIGNLSWLKLIIEMSIQGSFILLLSFIFIMNNQERKASWQRLKKLLRIK